MTHFLCRLNPPRPTFAADMSPEELELMGEHGVYWSGHLREGRSLIFGVVDDPTGTWGVTIIEVDDEATARRLTREDPAIRSGRGFSYDILAMPNAVTARMAEDS